MFCLFFLANSFERPDGGRLCGLSQLLNGLTYKKIGEKLEEIRNGKRRLPPCYWVKGKPRFHDDCLKIFSKTFRGRAFASFGNWTEGIRHQHIEAQHTLKPENYTLAKQFKAKKSTFNPETVKDWDFKSKTGLTEPILDCFHDAEILPDSTVKFEHAVYPDEVANAEPKHRFFLIFSARSSTGETIFGSFVEPVNPCDKAILGKTGEELEELGQLERFNQKERKVVSQCHLHYEPNGSIVRFGILSFFSCGVGESDKGNKRKFPEDYFDGNSGKKKRTT